jgi:hypothetical protein
MDKVFAWGVVAAVVFLIVVAALSTPATFPAVNPVLEGWTKWVASVVAIIVSARVLWTTAVWIERKLT